MIERRAQPFIIDEAKFSTQKFVTYILLLFFCVVMGNVLFLGDDQSERSTIIQTVINLAFLAAGFWLGSSKGAADTRDQMTKLMTPIAGTTTTTTTPAEQPPETPK